VIYNNRKNFSSGGSTFGPGGTGLQILPRPPNLAQAPKFYRVIIYITLIRANFATCQSSAMESV